MNLPRKRSSGATLHELAFVLWQKSAVQAKTFWLSKSNVSQVVPRTPKYNPFMGFEFRVFRLGPSRTRTLAEIEQCSTNYPVAKQWLTCTRTARAGFVAVAMKRPICKLTHAAILQTAQLQEKMLFRHGDADLLPQCGSHRKRPAPLSCGAAISSKRPLPVFDCFLAALVFAEAWLALVEGTPDLALNATQGNRCRWRDATERHLALSRNAPCLQFTLAPRTIEVDLVQEIIRMFHLKQPSDAPDTVAVASAHTPLWDDSTVQIDVRTWNSAQAAAAKTLLSAQGDCGPSGGATFPNRRCCDALWGDEERAPAAQRPVYYRAAIAQAPRIERIRSATRRRNHTLNAADCAGCILGVRGRLADTGFDSQKSSPCTAVLPARDEGRVVECGAKRALRGKFIDALSGYGATLESEGDLPGAVRYICAASMPTRS